MRGYSLQRRALDWYTFSGRQIPPFTPPHYVASKHSMKKAFLCHSTRDKGYVDTVAHKLTRARVIYDKLSFQPGEDFRKEIRKHLDEAALFIFFASRNSLDSDWCAFELDQAEIRSLTGGIEGQLTLIIDPSVTIQELPKWMQFTKAVVQPRPSQATRIVQAALYSLQPETFKPPFIGRTKQLNEFVQVFSSRDPSPSIFVLSGLDGVGRRTYLERAIKDNLGLDLGPYFLFDDTKRLEDVYLWLFNETDDLASRGEIKNELEAFAKLSSAEQTLEIARRLHLLCEANAVPCFVDYGGLLTETGHFKPHFERILTHLTQTQKEYHVACILQRNPMTRDLSFADKLFQQRIPPLDDNESKLLLQQLLKRLSVSATGDQINELLEYLAGYPPAIYLASRHSKSYGLSNLIADKSVLVDFQANRFTGLVTKLILSEKEWFVLRYLSSELVVPLAVIALAADITHEDAAPILRNLIEQSLVVVVDDNYGLSAPIRNAIERVKGNLDSTAYAAICAKLTQSFWVGDNAAPTVEIVDATLHAAARTGSVDLRPYSDLIRVSTIHRLALECYHRREWIQAEQYVNRARQMDPDSVDLLELQFKCFVRLERFDAADKLLPELKTIGERSYYYLKGFLYRMQRKHSAAVDAFATAEAAGNRSLALLRDYADCLHRIGQDKEALKKIELARTREPANIYILDLYIRICVAAGNHKEAEVALVELDRYDVDRRFIHHRKSTIYAAKHSWDAALRETEAAIRSNKATFEAYCQRADILIALHRYEDAVTQLGEIKTTFGSFRNDVQMGLRCKLHIRQGDWRQAEIIWNALGDKSTEINNVLLRQIYELKASDTGISLTARQQARDELALLDPELRDLSQLYGPED
jgi:tetratricopeptide (TPR) repeat protein